MKRIYNRRKSTDWKVCRWFRTRTSKGSQTFLKAFIQERSGNNAQKAQDWVPTEAKDECGGESTCCGQGYPLLAHASLQSAFVFLACLSERFSGYVRRSLVKYLYNVIFKASFIPLWHSWWEVSRPHPPNAIMEKYWGYLIWCCSYKSANLPKLNSCHMVVYPESPWTNVQHLDTSWGCTRPHTGRSLPCICLLASAFICVHLHSSACLRLIRASTCICVRLHPSACICVHLHASVCIYVRLCASASIYMRLHVSACVCVHLHTSAYICIRLRASEYVCVYLHSHVCSCKNQLLTVL